MSDLVLVAVVCHFCRLPYEREIEPEWQNIVQRWGLCDSCCDKGPTQDME